VRPNAEGPKLRTPEEWRGYLAEYAADVLRLAEERELSNVTGEQRAEGWLGYPGASEERLAVVEERLGIRLPPSYRAFLAASDGWLNLGRHVWEMRTTDNLAWLTEVMAGWGEEDSEEEALTDRALLVSADGEAYWLLDPEDVSDDGEWAAYVWASWYPGFGERHASFADLVKAERAEFERVKGYSGQGVRPEGADALVAEGRLRALRGEADQAMEAFDRAAVKGSGVGAYLNVVLGALLDLRTAHHAIRNGVLGRPHLIEVMGADRVRAEALSLYLRSTVTDYGRPVGLPRLPAADELAPELLTSADEPIEAWTARAAAYHPPAAPENPEFQRSLDRARGLALRGEHDEAWAVVEAALPSWRAGSPDQIVPVSLLADPALRDLITPYRARVIARTPRGEGRAAP